jgi:phenylalanyl-tRNA synthetase beta chain
VYRPKALATQETAPLRSLGVRLTLSSIDATLTEAQIEQSVKAVLEQLDRDLGARQRV